MKPTHFLKGIVAAVALAASAASTAVPITFTHEGVGTGSLDNQLFFDEKAFKITVEADTDDRLNCVLGCQYINAISASIQISGLGTFDFVTATRTFANGNTVGFSRAGEFGADLFSGPQDSALANYELDTAIGPISSSDGGVLQQWEADPYGEVVTTGGVLFMNFDPDTPVIFTAQLGHAVPEPSSLVLACAALFALGLRRRRAN